MSLEEITSAAASDPTQIAVKDLIKSGKWYLVNKADWPKNVDVQALKSFSNVRNELSITTDGVIIRGPRLVVPATLQKKTVELAHIGHQGVVKTKSLIREKVWFPGIDN